MADPLAPPAPPSSLQPGAPTVGGALVGGQSNAGFFLQGPDYGIHTMLDALPLLIGRPMGEFNPSVPGFGAFPGYGLPQDWKTLTAAQDTIYGTGGDASTAVGGVPLYWDGDDGGFLADNGGDPSTWLEGTNGRRVRRFISLLLNAQNRAQIPAIVWLHTESDSQLRDQYGDRTRYKAALRRWFTLLRTWIGKSAAQLPVFVALPMPYAPANGGTHRMIREVFAELAAETAFNFHVALRQTADSDPRDGYDSSHIDHDDMRNWARRLAFALARWFNGLYGTPIPAIGKGTGPVFVHAYAESTTSTIVTAEHDRGNTLRLGTGAADARGWSFIDSGTWKEVDSVELVNATQIRLRHPARVAAPQFCEIAYCMYGERLWRGGGIYDNAGSLPAIPALSSLGENWRFDWPAAGMLTPLTPSSTPYSGGTTPPPDPDPEDVGRLELTPVHIGTLNEAVPSGGVAVPITVGTSPDITSISWVVLRADFTWRGGAVTVAATGETLIEPRFFAAGDTLKVWITGDEGRAVHSEAVIAVIPPTGRFLTGSPFEVGTQVTDGAGGADFAFTIQSGGGVSRLEWVLVGPAPDYFWDGFSRVITATGTTRIPVRFTRDGEFFRCWDPDNPTLQFTSGAVSLTIGEPGDAALSFLSDPGTLYESSAGTGATWTFSVGTNGIARLGVVVVNPDYGWADGGQVITLPSSGSHVTSVSVIFRQSGQFVKLYNADDFSMTLDGLAVLLAVAPVDTSNPDPAGLAFAKAWFQGLAVSLNIERAWGWAIPGGVAAAAAYYKSIGIDDVRIFYPWRPAYDMNGEGTTRPTKAQFARLLDATAQYVSAGLKVRLFMCDVLTAYEDMTNSGNIAAITAHITDASAWIAERNFDPNKVAIGAVNELGGDADYVAYQQQWHTIMRNALPGYLLSCGANYWQAWNYLVASTPWTTDKRTYWPVHMYEAHNTVGWTDVRNQLRAWGAAHGGIFVAVDEWGGGNSNDSQTPSVWLSQLDSFFPAMQEFRPSLWVITYGSEWRWNASGSFRIRPELEAKLIAVAAQAKIDLANPDEEPEEPPPIELPDGAGTITPPVISITLPDGVVVNVPAGSQIVGLFHSLVDPTNKFEPILLREAIGNAQDDLGALAEEANAVKEALAALQAATNAAIAYLAQNTLPLPPGPLASNAAAAAAGIPVGGSYFDAAGVVHRRLPVAGEVLPP